MAFAFRKLKRHDFLNVDIVESGLTLLGLVAIADPLQEGVVETVAELKKRGLTVSLCTGDRRETALATASAAGILTPSTRIFRGSAPEKETNFVAYECTPTDKQVCIQQLPDVLAVGDGYNDLGMFSNSKIAVSIMGTSAIEQASDISIETFADLSRVFSISGMARETSVQLIHLTVFRTALVTACLFLYAIIEPAAGSLFNGLIIQGFNTVWTATSMALLVFGMGSGPVSLRQTFNWLVYGLLAGLTIVALLVGFNLEPSLAAPICIGLVNLVHTRFSLRLLGLGGGLLAFSGYAIYMQSGVLPELQQTTWTFWTVLFGAILIEKKFANC